MEDESSGLCHPLEHGWSQAPHLGDRGLVQTQWKITRQIHQLLTIVEPHLITLL